MISVALASVLIPLVIIYCYINAYKKPKNYPPGPPSLPVYGALPILRAYGYRDIAKACKRLSEIYNTKVLGFYLSVFPIVVVNGEALIREMLTREDFDGRTDVFIGRLRSYWKRLGIFFTDGYFWFVQRRFTLRKMRDFGFGRRCENLEQVVDYEIKEMIDMVANGPKYPTEKGIVKGDLVYLHRCFAVPFMNGLMHVIAQTTLPRPEYHVLWKISQNAMKFQLNTDDFGGALSVTPSLKHLAPNMSGYNNLRESNQCMLDFFTKLIDEALETHDEFYDRHFLDSYIRKMKEEQRQFEKTTYSVEQLRLTCVDYMLPTATGVENLLAILVERMLIQPEIQEKVHEEIDRVVGRDRRPTLDDRRNMPYTEACLREVMRYDTLIPMGILHRAVKDTTIGGYDLPENTTIAANYESLHFSKEVWGDPENFRPERFIENGRLNVAKDRSLPFGAGRRLCAGETFARQTMFQVFAAFMQAFQVLTADGRPLLKPAPRLQGIFNTLPEFWVRVTPRDYKQLIQSF